MLVVDASVLAASLADDTDDGDRARAALRGHDLATPELVDVEVASVLRKLVHVGLVDERRAGLAIADLVDLPLQRAPHAGLIPRCWALRENLTMYDAVYVALAEVMDATLVTADARLARAPGVTCSISLLA